MPTLTAVFQLGDKHDLGNGSCQLRFFPPYSVSSTAGVGQKRVNDAWSKNTPVGRLEMTVTVPGIAERFELNKNYQLTFEELPEERAE